MLQVLRPISIPGRLYQNLLKRLATVIKKDDWMFMYLKQSEIKVLVSEKRNYLLQNEDDFIPIELDIKNWINFLPPLQNIKNKTPTNLDNTFPKFIQRGY